MTEILLFLEWLCDLVFAIGRWLGAFLADPVSNVVALMSVFMAIASGLWILRDSRLRDRYFPKIEFFTDVFFKIEREHEWVVEVICSIRNRGIVRFSVADLKFEVRGLKGSDPLQLTTKKTGEQTEFPHIIKSGKWYQGDAKTFVETETAQFYRHIITIPKSYDAVLVHGTLEYSAKINGKPVHHSTDRLVRVPDNLDEAKDYVGDEKVRIFLRDEAFDRTVRNDF